MNGPPVPSQLLWKHIFYPESATFFSFLFSLTAISLLVSNIGLLNPISGCLFFSCGTSSSMKSNSWNQFQNQHWPLEEILGALRTERRSQYGLANIYAKTTWPSMYCKRVRRHVLEVRSSVDIYMDSGQWTQYISSPYGCFLAADDIIDRWKVTGIDCYSQR